MRKVDMTDQERVEFVKNLNVEDYRKIPGYWKEYLTQKTDSIHKKQIQAGVESASFAALADFHLTGNALHSPAILEKVTAECGIPYVFLAGDFVSGMGIITKENLIREVETVRRLFYPIEDKLLLVQGNHDPAYSEFEAPDYYAQDLSKEEIYEYMFRQQTRYPSRVFGEEGRYFYADDTFHKVRYIALDTHDTPSDEIREDGHPVYQKFRLTGFCQKQVSWFADTAMQVPDREWTVVLCTHESLHDDVGENYYNAELIFGIIDAFRKHTCYEGKTDYKDRPGYNAAISVDFTGKGGDFALWFGGHTHRDIIQDHNGIITMSIAADVKLPKQGTTDEQTITVFMIDKKNHRLLLTRIGEGEDRELEYQVFE